MVVEWLFMPFLLGIATLLIDVFASKLAYPLGAVGGAFWGVAFWSWSRWSRAAIVAASTASFCLAVFGLGYMLLLRTPLARHLPRS